VIEIISGELLEYWIECPEDLKGQVIDWAFMTHVYNPEFQKYYGHTEEFKRMISEPKIDLYRHFLCDGKIGYDDLLNASSCVVGCPSIIYKCWCCDMWHITFMDIKVQNIN
jgi:hypothetical protein